MLVVAEVVVDGNQFNLLIIEEEAGGAFFSFNDRVFVRYTRSLAIGPEERNQAIYRYTQQYYFR